MLITRAEVCVCVRRQQMYQSAPLPVRMMVFEWLVWGRFFSFFTVESSVLAWIDPDQ